MYQNYSSLSILESLFSPEQFRGIPKVISRTQVFYIDRLSRD